MKLPIFRFHCGACKSWYEAPVLGGSTYGEFLLRSDSGEMRYLDANRDLTFEEVDRLMRCDHRVVALDSFERADLLHDLFGTACDPDSQGNAFRIDLKARCPNCCERHVTWWESVEPPTYVELEIFPVTHEAWSMRSETEKLAAISAAIDASDLI